MTLDRRQPPEPAPRRPVAFPPIERHRLDNGLLLLVVRLPQLPVVRMDLLHPGAGAHHDPPEKAGLATLTSLLLDEGRPGETATEAAEQVGGSLYTGATRNTAAINVTLLSEHLYEGLELLARVGRHATFPTAQFKRLQAQRLANLAQQRADRRYTADRYLAWAIHRDSAYGRPLHGDLASIRRIERDDLMRFYATRYRPAGSTLVAVGDLDREALCERAAAQLGAPDDRPPIPPPRVEPPSPGGREVHVVDDPAAAHVELRLGQATIPHAHPDTVLLELANVILAGTPTSRLHARLREAEGLAYSVKSRLVGQAGAGSYEIATAVPTEATASAARQVLGEIERFLDSGPTAEELEQARRYLEGNLAAQLQTIEQVVNKLSLLGVFDLSADHYEELLRRITTAREEEILAAARRHLDPQCMVLVALGPGSSLARQLEPIGSLNRWDPSTGARSLASGS